MLESFRRLSSTLRRNSLSDSIWGGRRAIIKRRSRAGRRIAGIANFYFRLARIPIRFLANPDRWQRREVRCFRMLNRPFDARALSGRRVVEQQLPGQSIEEHLRRGTLSRRMVRAAG